MKNINNVKLICLEETEMRLINGGSGLGDWLVDTIGDAICSFKGFAKEIGNLWAAHSGKIVHPGSTFQ